NNRYHASDRALLVRRAPCMDPARDNPIGRLAIRKLNMVAPLATGRNRGEYVVGKHHNDSNDVRGDPPDRPHGLWLNRGYRTSRYYHSDSPDNRAMAGSRLSENRLGLSDLSGSRI